MVNGGRSFREAEHELIGFTHTEVGQLLSQKWRFPLTMENAIANHHEPGDVRPFCELAHIVSLANSLCHKLNLGLTMRPALNTYELESAKALGLRDAVIADTLKLLAETETNSDEDEQ